MRILGNFIKTVAAKCTVPVLYNLLHFRIFSTLFFQFSAFSAFYTYIYV